MEAPSALEETSAKTGADQPGPEPPWAELPKVLTRGASSKSQDPAGRKGMGCVLSIHSNVPGRGVEDSGAAPRLPAAVGNTETELQTRERKRDPLASLASTTSWVEPMDLKPHSFKCHLLEAWPPPT